MNLTQSEFQKATGCSVANAAKWYDAFNAAMAMGAIDTPLRVAHFLAQVGHESLSFLYPKEIWGPTAQQLKYDPASGSQLSKDLGNVIKGDGKLYQGRGFIQITGRSNYRRLSSDFGIDFISNPELLEQGTMPVQSAVWFWNDKNISPLADADDIVAVTKKVNGGENGIDDRKVRLALAKAIILPKG